MKRIPQDKRRELTKGKIVDAAMQLFSTKGYYQTNSKEIAKLAGVSIGSFYTYFKDKKVLLIDILDTYIQNTLELRTEISGFGKNCIEDRAYTLKALIDKCFDFHQFPIGFFQQVTMLSAVDQEIAMVYKQYKETFLLRIKEILSSCETSFPDDNLKAACIIVYSAIEGSIHAVKFSASDVEERLLKDELVRFLDAYLSGLQLLH